MLAENPYVGPRTFTAAERDRFFGREREARDLLGLVSTEQLVLIYAQSGAGKSSLVNTCLIPDLQRKNFEVFPVARVRGDEPLGIEPSNIYIFSLLRSIDQHHTDPRLFSQLLLKDFLRNLDRDDAGYFFDPHPALELSEAAHSSSKRRALIIDQFEELFTTHLEAWQKRDDFFVQVAQALDEDPALSIVLVLREDYLAGLDPYAHYLPRGLHGRYYIERLNREAALKAVQQPVADVRPFAPGVAERLVEDLSLIKVALPDGSSSVFPGRFVEPVQLQVVCYGLWQNLPTSGTEITREDLEVIGDVNQSLRRHYDRRVYEVAESKNVRESLIREWIEKKLIGPGGIRNLVLQERTSRLGELDDSVIQSLQSDLVRAEIRGGVVWYELTHDRLVEPILESNKIWFNEHLSPLQRQAALWNEQEREESWLLRDQSLLAAETSAMENPDGLTVLERDFLQASRRLQTQTEAEQQRIKMAQELAQQARSARRARTLDIVSAVLMAIVVFQSVLLFRGANNISLTITLLFIIAAVLLGYLVGRSRHS